MEEQRIITDFLLTNIIFTISELKPDQPLIDSLLIDSISIIKVILFIEKQFNISLDDADLDPKYFESVENMVQLVIKKRREKELAK